MGITSQFARCHINEIRAYRLLNMDDRRPRVMELIDMDVLQPVLLRLLIFFKLGDLVAYGLSSLLRGHAVP